MLAVIEIMKIDAIANEKAMELTIKKYNIEYGEFDSLIMSKEAMNFYIQQLKEETIKLIKEFTNE